MTTEAELEAIRARKLASIKARWHLDPTLPPMRKHLAHADMAYVLDRLDGLLAEIDRLRAGLERILAEHQQIVGDTRSYCLICAPGDGHYPCVTVLEARAALGVGGE